MSDTFPVFLQELKILIDALSLLPMRTIPTRCALVLASFGNTMSLKNFACLYSLASSKAVQTCAIDQVKISTRIMIKTMVPRPIYI
ncbi:MAG: hypothetical protein A3I66_11025 [Burkholderiales bacterium RIFCSPLOWO2_02_FULL_57_36]|nr:MAG: hypothetical protein A3I66_11025 [Burkholderiales bacterium RIFCSPLOWO2_02_FULL_57_36]